jgi:ketosteroid isomerase-like protein
MNPATTTESPVQRVANRLVELCSVGKYREALTELYAENARHVEAMAMPGCDRITEGKATLLQKSDEFSRTMTVHSESCGKPLVNGDQFLCEMSMDCTHHHGPMAGQRMQMTEQCLYTVTDGKITEAKFFYPMG